MTATDTYGNPLGRGGYARDGRGSALVASPDAADVYRSGVNRGKVKLYPYKAASSIALGSSHEALDRWKQNQILQAFVLDATLRDRLAEALEGIEDYGSGAAKDVLNRFQVEAHEIVNISRAADAGTFAHWLTECVDNGLSPLEGLAAGEATGVDSFTAKRVMDGWATVCRSYGFRMLAVELPLVNDELRAAGTTDRVIELGSPLRYAVNNRVHHLPAGAVLIGDFKSGKLRFGRDGLPIFWEKYTGQIAAYAGGVPYQPATHTRLEWQDVGVRVAPSQRAGVLIHCDLLALVNDPLMDAVDAFHVFIVDLERGRAYAQASNVLRVVEGDARLAWSHVGRAEAVEVVA